MVTSDGCRLTVLTRTRRARVCEFCAAGGLPAVHHSAASREVGGICGPARRGRADLAGISHRASGSRAGRLVLGSPGHVRCPATGATVRFYTDMPRRPEPYTGRHRALPKRRRAPDGQRDVAASQAEQAGRPPLPRPLPAAEQVAGPDGRRSLPAVVRRVAGAWAVRHGPRGPAPRGAPVAPDSSGPRP